MILTLLNDFNSFTTLVEEVTADVAETAREPVLDVDPQDVTGLLHLKI